MDCVLFLDIDGVLNTVPTHRPIEPEKVRLLGRIIQATHAHVVLHSGWRFWFDCALRPLREESSHLAACLAAEGIVLSGMTPDLSTEEIRRTRKFSSVKASEILAWLHQHPQVRHWAVLDDLDLHNGVISAHQIRPDSSSGLTEADAVSAIHLLSK